MNVSVDKLAVRQELNKMGFGQLEDRKSPVDEAMKVVLQKEEYPRVDVEYEGSSAPTPGVAGIVYENK